MRKTLAVAALAAALAGCGGGGAGGGDGGSAVEVGLKEFRFVPKQLTAPAGSVAFAVDNRGKQPHTFVISSGKQRIAGTKDIEPGGKTTLQAELRPGTYEVVCVLPGHRPAGMEGVLRVE